MARLWRRARKAKVQNSPLFCRSKLTRGPRAWRWAKDSLDTAVFRKSKPVLEQNDIMSALGMYGIMIGVLKNRLEGTPLMFRFIRMIL